MYRLFGVCWNRGDANQFISAELIRSFLFAFGILASLSATAQSTAVEKAVVEVPTGKGELGLRLDCGHDFNRNRGGNQDCVQISGLRLTYSESLSPKVRGRIRIDPFGTVAQRFEKSPDRGNVPLGNLEGRLGIVDDYSVEWNPRPLLQLSIRKFQGVAQIPSVSDLPSGGSLQDSGWDQTALTAEYRLPALVGTNVVVAAGNGEGENGVNLDPQQYVGFRIETEFYEGIRGVFGMSSDGNNAGSAEYSYLYSSKEVPAVGFSTQRLGAGLELNGKLPAFRGLKAGLGWQRANLNDLNKDIDSVPPAANRKHPEDPSFLVVEDQTHAEAETIRRTVYAASFSYRILDKYFLGTDYEIRQITFNNETPFQGCRNIANGICDKDGVSGRAMSQAAYTIGFGFDLADGILLVMDYKKISFDKLYETYNYQGRDGARTDNSEIFNARLSYNWK